MNRQLFILCMLLVFMPYLVKSMEKQQEQVEDSKDATATINLTQSIIIPDVPIQQQAPELATPAHFIIIGHEPQIAGLSPLATDQLQAALGLRGKNSLTLLQSYADRTADKIVAAIAKEPSKAPVIIATTDYSSIIADATTKIIAEKSKAIHSIILFEPITKDVIFSYQAITNRIFNFYSETLCRLTGYRKISPAKAIGKDNNPYLMGINIKCFDFDNKCEAKTFEFYGQLKDMSWGGWCKKVISSTVKLETNFPMSNQFENAIPNIIQTIQHIQNNHDFQLNTDLSCILNGNATSCTPVLGGEKQHEFIKLCIPKNYPFIFINRFIDFNKGTPGGKLLYLVASGKYLKNVVWTSEISAKEIATVEAQLNLEAGINSKKMAELPYCQPIIQTVRYGGTPRQWNWFFEQPIIKKDKHRNDTAEVRTTPGLCREENEFLTQRNHVTKPVLATFLGIQEAQLKEKPTIAIVASGGGIRAMLTTFGFLKGLEKIGLLNAVTYIGCLSGSTWAVASWISSGSTLALTSDALTKKLPSFNTATNTLFENAIVLAKNVAYKSFAWAKPVDELNAINAAFNEPFGTIDIYGSFLAENLLGLKPNEPINISQQITKIAAGNLPLPIYTAMNPDPVKKEQSWFEFTPYESGWTNNDFHIPSWSLGRKFMCGYSQSQAPEQPLTSLLAVFGSAFAFSLAEVGSPIWTDWRPFGKEYLNPIYGLDDPLGKLDKIITVDAGLAFNLPYPPIGKRNPNVIIFIDASMDIAKNKDKIVNGDALIAARKYAVDNGLEFPTTDKLKLYKTNPEGHFSNDSITILQGAANQPTIIYMPLAKDKTILEQDNFTDLKKDSFKDLNFTQYDTFKFNYTESESNRLMNLVEFNVRANAQKIRAALLAKLSIAKPQTPSPEPQQPEIVTIQEIEQVLTQATTIFEEAAKVLLTKYKEKDKVPKDTSGYMDNWKLKKDRAVKMQSGVSRNDWEQMKKELFEYEQKWLTDYLPKHK